MQLPFQVDAVRKISVEKLRCVECKMPLKIISPTEISCKNSHKFRISNNVPILLSKESEHVLQKTRASSSGKMMKQEYDLLKSSRIKKYIKRITTTPNISIRMFNSNKILDVLTNNENSKDVIVSIGGGPKRDRNNIINLNIDTYLDVDIVGDAHNLPFKNNSIDGIVINAVLEHLESPIIAVNEIFRVLKKGGYVLAETPFLQHYHGYPLHFQNYTLTGHNYLFKKFKILQSGPIEGPFCTLSNLVMNIPEDLITNKYVRKIILYIFAICLLPIRMLDIFLINNRNVYKLTSGVYVFAQKQ